MVLNWFPICFYQTTYSQQSAYRIIRVETYVKDFAHILDVLRRIFLSLEKLLSAMFLQKKSIMQVLAANILVRIPIVKIVCEWFLP